MLSRLPVPLLLAAVLFGAVNPIAGQSTPPSPWVGESDYRAFYLQGDEKNKADLAAATFDTPAGKKEGLRFTVHDAAKSALAVQAILDNPLPVAAKDTLFAHFYMRTTSSELESGEGKVQFIVENIKTYEKSVQFPAAAASEWKEFNVPFAAKESYLPGTAHIIIRLGYRRQTIEIAGLEVTNHGSSVAVSSLPRTLPDLRYPGMEDNAPWRAAADARIEKSRKSALVVEVVDAAGKPVADAPVEVQQTRHRFIFGSAISARALVDSFTGQDKRLSEAVLSNFNLITLENDLKWPQWEKDRELPLQAARWCQEHGVALRAHTMVWPSWRHLPPALKEMKTRPNELRAAVLNHVRDIGGALTPYASIWDVVNEPFTNHDLMDVLGRPVLLDIFREARRAAAPQTRLFLNDYGIVNSNGTDRAHQDHFEGTIRFLLDQHAPLEGIGIQGHFGQEYTSPERIYAILDRYAAFGLPLQMTEFTAQADDRELDAKVLRDVMTVFFSHPAADAFILWGFYDGRGFEHKATLYDAGGQLTPAGKMYRDLVFGRWWTHERATTGADGAARVSGFHGQYSVTVGKGDAAVTRQVELPPGGATLRVVAQ